MTKSLTRATLAAVCSLAALSFIDTNAAEARGGGWGHSYGGRQVCFNHYDNSVLRCYMRNGRRHCAPGGYVVICR